MPKFSCEIIPNNNLSPLDRIDLADSINRWERSTCDMDTLATVESNRELVQLWLGEKSTTIRLLVSSIEFDTADLVHELEVAIPNRLAKNIVVKAVDS